MDNNLSTILRWNQCVCVCVFVYVSPHFFELNQNGHNSANFEARTFRFCMVVDLEEDEEDNDDDNNNNIFFAERSKVKDVKRIEANPCGAASFAKPR